MKHSPRVAFIAENLLQLTTLFHGLFRFGTGSGCDRKTNFIRYTILKCLQVHGECYLTDIAEMMRYKKNTLSEMIDRIVDDGLVRRGPHPADRRKVVLSLTDKGVAALRSFEQLFMNNMEEFLQKLDAETRSAWVSGLESLIQVARAHPAVFHFK